MEPITDESVVRAFVDATAHYSSREAGQFVGVSHTKVQEWRDGKVVPLQPKTRRALRAYLEKASASRGLQELALLKRAAGTAKTPAQFIAAAYAIAEEDGWSAAAWRELDRWKASQQDEPPEGPTPVVPADWLRMLAEANDRLNRLQQELDGLPPGSPLGLRRKSPSRPAEGNRHTHAGRKIREAGASPRSAGRRRPARE